MSTKTRIGLSAVWAVSLSLAACSERSEGTANAPSGRSGSATTDSSQWAATVNDAPISLDEVRVLIEHTDAGLTKEEAVDVLVRNELLAEEAWRRGYGRHSHTEQTRKAALARRLLEREIGEGTTPASIDRNKLLQYYEANKARFVHGVQRHVAHFLVQTGDNQFSDSEALAIAREFHDRAQNAKSLDEFEALANTTIEQRGTNARIEHLPPFAADSKAFVAPFVQATFAIPGAGQISPPVKTSFGWHVIFVIEEQPASHRTFSDVEEELVKEVIPEERKIRARALIEKLEREADIFVYESNLTTGGTAP